MVSLSALDASAPESYNTRCHVDMVSGNGESTTLNLRQKVDTKTCCNIGGGNGCDTEKSNHFECSLIQEFLPGKISSCDESGETCNDKHRKEWGVYAARFEAWNHGQWTVINNVNASENIVRRDEDIFLTDPEMEKKDGTNLVDESNTRNSCSQNHCELVDTRLPIDTIKNSGRNSKDSLSLDNALQEISLAPSSGAISKSSVVATALKVNTRAGAIPDLRRKSLIGAPSSICQGGLGLCGEVEVNEDDRLMERILKRPKAVLQSISPDFQSESVGDDKLSVEVELRLRAGMKGVESNEMPLIADQQFSKSNTSSSGSDDGGSIIVHTKQPRVNIDSGSDRGVGTEKKFSTPTKIPGSERNAQVSLLTKKVDASDLATFGNDPMNPFDLHEYMFELSEDSSDASM
jgi:hypothetical protein